MGVVVTLKGGVKMMNGCGCNVESRGYNDLDYSCNVERRDYNDLGCVCNVE